jgi:GDP-4-dehydro-6-deoxy-D-mannose reductase
MKVLVTGAHGFVGRHLLAHLTASGDEAVGTDRIAGGPDLDDVDGMRDLFVAEAPEVVVHLAAQADVGGSWQSAVSTMRTNVEGTMNVLAAARAAGSRRVVAVTSADIYGIVTPDELPLDESAPLRPVSPYAASKAAADMVCLQAGFGYGQDVVRVRAFNHLGPGQSDRFVASALASRVATAERSGDRVLRVGTLDTRRDFTDVRDVVRAYRLLALHGQAGEAYNVCSGRDVSIAEIVDGLLGLARVPLTLEVDPELVRPVDLPVLRGDASKLRAATGWEPDIPLEVTLRDVLDDWRDRLRTSEAP